MPIRFRITLLFVALVMFILGMLCIGIYYFSYGARINTIKTRLVNRAITTSRLLAQREIFDKQLVMRIDSLTTIALKNKTVQAYDYQNRKIYTYSDIPFDTFYVNEDILNDARVNGTKYFTISDKEAIAYHYSDSDARLVVVSAGEDVEGIQNLQTLKSILIVSFLIGTFIILITGYLFSTRLLEPIKKITSDVEEISAQNLARRIKTGSTRDEWYKLANTLNQLLNRLQESFDLQRRFISNASHELSTPLTSISSQLEVSMQRKRDADDYLRVMQSIYQDVRNMSKLTQTLLEFAQTAGNPGGLEISLIRIDEVILRLPSEIGRLDPAYTVKVQFGNLPENEENLLVFGNEPLLFTAIKNIVVNGCKYSNDHSTEVYLDANVRQVIITVTDKGKGIPATALKYIFQPFYRAEENVSSEGFGLGLSLADRIVKLHNGAIEVQSSLNVGTQFIITFPTARSLG